MYFLPPLTLAIYLFSVGSCAAGDNWPRPESLVAFYPFDGIAQLRDIANNKGLVPHSSSDCPRLMTDIDGPFVKPGTSYSVSRDDECDIGWRGEADIPLTEKFTISFYFFTQLKSHGGILDFFFWGPRFGLSYLEPNVLEIWGGPEWGKVIGRFPSILKSNTWSFTAITYDKASGNLTIYDQDGQEISSTFTQAVVMNETNYLIVGRAVIGQGYQNNIYMKSNDAMACLMYYNTTLSPSEIAKLSYVCQTNQHSPTTTRTASMLETTTNTATKAETLRLNGLILLHIIFSLTLFNFQKCT